MSLISLNTAALLSGVSKRTLWRRIAAGDLSTTRTGDPPGRTLISLDDIGKYIGLPFSDEIFSAIHRADAGLATNQLELALIFLEAGLMEKALPWLELAANQGDTDAMLTLGETQLEYPEANHKTGLNWIRRAAIAGHPLALAVMEALSAQLNTE